MPTAIKPSVCSFNAVNVESIAAVTTSMPQVNAVSLQPSVMLPSAHPAIYSPNMSSQGSINTTITSYSSVQVSNFV